MLFLQPFCRSLSLIFCAKNTTFNVEDRKYNKIKHKISFSKELEFSHYLNFSLAQSTHEKLIINILKYKFLDTNTN